MTWSGTLETIGKDFTKGLQWAVVYAVPVERLASLLFPAAAPAIAGLAGATSLIQTAVLLVEQKYAAAGLQSGTGAQKLTEVMTLAGPVVTQMLMQAGLPVSTEYLQKVVSAVVAILNVQQMPAATA